MSDPLTLRVLTNAGVVLQESARSIIAPGGLGYLGMLRRHAPLVTTVVPGKLTWRRGDGSSRSVRVASGLLEVEHDRVTLFTISMADADQPT